jgi:hypothetical protein
VDEESETRADAAAAVVAPVFPSPWGYRERVLDDRIAARGMGAGARAVSRARGAAHRVRTKVWRESLVLGGVLEKSMTFPGL